MYRKACHNLQTPYDWSGAKCGHLVDLEDAEYLLANIGFGTAENKPSKVYLRGPYTLQLHNLDSSFTAQTLSFLIRKVNEVQSLE